jgi:hypothetical protein
VKLPLDEKPGHSSRNWRAAGDEKETAELSSVDTTHWFHPAVLLFTADEPMGQVTELGKEKAA